MLTVLTHALAAAAGFCFASWLFVLPMSWLGKILNHVPKG